VKLVSDEMEVTSEVFIVVAELGELSPVVDEFE
jgi:hypothetical protein